MSKYLKGNYPLPKSRATPEGPDPKQEAATSTEQFERRALERLGGSIAFVVKNNTFVWKGK